MRTRFALWLLAPILVVGIAIIFIASPLRAAFNLREAVRTGDTATIQRMVHWPSLRKSIRETVAQNARLLPIAEASARKLRPTLWQRVRSLFGHSMLDRFIERYITAKGLPELYKAKTLWHTRMKRNAYRNEAKVQQAGVTLGIDTEGLARAWRRIKRAEFTSLFRFVLEAEDPHNAARLIKSTFQLEDINWRGFDWKLTTISIRTISPSKAHLARLNAFR